MTRNMRLRTRRLRFEQLESRTVLAVSGFSVELPTGFTPQDSETVGNVIFIAGDFNNKPAFLSVNLDSEAESTPLTSDLTVLNTPFSANDVGGIADVAAAQDGTVSFVGFGMTDASAAVSSFQTLRWAISGSVTQVPFPIAEFPSSLGVRASATSVLSVSGGTEAFIQSDDGSSIVGLPFIDAAFPASANAELSVLGGTDGGNAVIWLREGITGDVTRVQVMSDGGDQLTSIGFGVTDIVGSTFVVEYQADDGSAIGIGSTTDGVATFVADGTLPELAMSATLDGQSYVAFTSPGGVAMLNVNGESLPFLDYVTELGTAGLSRVQSFYVSGSFEEVVETETEITTTVGDVLDAVVEGNGGSYYFVRFAHATGESVEFLHRFHNVDNPMDVNDDGVRSPIDVLIIINDLNSNGPRSLQSASFAGAYLDVNGDGTVSPIDALVIINDLNSVALGEGEFAPMLFEQARLRTQGDTSLRQLHSSVIEMRHRVFASDCQRAIPQHSISLVGARNRERIFAEEEAGDLL